MASHQRTYTVTNYSIAGQAVGNGINVPEIDVVYISDRGGSDPARFDVTIVIGSISATRTGGPLTLTDAQAELALWLDRIEEAR